MTKSINTKIIYDWIQCMVNHKNLAWYSPKLFLFGMTVAMTSVSTNGQELKVRQATPKDPTSWAPLIHADYPASALSANLEGTVGIRLIVSKRGRVSRCSVERSSGHEILDQAACRGMRRHAVFYPALNVKGRPTTGSYSTVITYKINYRQVPRPSAPPLTRSVIT